MQGDAELIATAAGTPCSKRGRNDRQRPPHIDDRRHGALQSFGQTELGCEQPECRVQRELQKACPTAERIGGALALSPGREVIDRYVREIFWTSLHNVQLSHRVPDGSDHSEQIEDIERHDAALVAVKLAGRSPQLMLDSGGMGVGGVRRCALVLAACWPVVPSTALAEPVGWELPPAAARRYSPFFNGTFGGMSVGQRFESNAYLGSELGAFFGPWRASLRALFPFGVHQETGFSQSNPEFRSIASTKPALIFGATAGAALYTSRGFVASVSVGFMRSDVSDFGNMLGLSLLLEWITRHGVRIGFEPGILAAFGGEVLAECQTGACEQGEIRAFDRDFDTGVWLHFLVGIPFDAPAPVPTSTPE